MTLHDRYLSRYFRVPLTLILLARREAISNLAQKRELSFERGVMQGKNLATVPGGTPESGKRQGF